MSRNSLATGVSAHHFYNRVENETRRLLKRLCSHGPQIIYNMYIVHCILYRFSLFFFFCTPFTMQVRGFLIFEKFAKILKLAICSVKGTTVLIVF